jgi:2-methylaconitate cis-trans-isomerase PrpF
MSNDLLSIPCVLMRGGTSKGPFFLASDLPADTAERDRLLLEVMGSGHPLQIDGIGGGNALTSKVAIIDRSSRADADVDYLFAQVRVEQQVVDTSPTAATCWRRWARMPSSVGWCRLRIRRPRCASTTSTPAS